MGRDGPVGLGLLLGNDIGWTPAWGGSGCCCRWELPRAGWCGCDCLDEWFGVFLGGLGLSIISECFGSRFEQISLFCARFDGVDAADFSSPPMDDIPKGLVQKAGLFEHLVAFVENGALAVELFLLRRSSVLSHENFGKFAVETVAIAAF